MKGIVLLSLFIMLTLATGVAYSQKKTVSKTPNHNDPEIWTGNIDDRTVFDCKGKVGTLWIKGKIDGASEVVLKELTILGGVTVDDKIDGGSKVYFKAGNDVNIGGTIDNPRTEVEIITTGDVIIGGDINGGCKVTVTCKNFTVKGEINNAKTRVLVNNSGTFAVLGGVKAGFVSHTN
jgi:hypothetical protein